MAEDCELAAHVGVHDDQDMILNDASEMMMKDPGDCEAGSRADKHTTLNDGLDVVWRRSKQAAAERAQCINETGQRLSVALLRTRPARVARFSTQVEDQGYLV